MREDLETAQSVPVIPGNEPHEAEVYHQFHLSPGDYPGDDEVKRQAVDQWFTAALTRGRQPRSADVGFIGSLQQGRSIAIVKAVTGLGRVASWALLVGTIYGAALVVGAFLAPVYKSTGVASTGAVTHRSETLVDVNGLGVVIVLGLPLLITVVVGFALWQGSRRGATPLAWALTGLLAAFNLLAMLSIGVFVLPVTAALVVACSTSRTRPQRHRVPDDKEL